MNHILSKILHLKQSYSMINITDIKTHGEISKIFHVKPDMVNKIAASITENGYDASQPLVIGRIRDIGDYLVDGHTRKEAAQKAGINKVPVKFMDFENLEDAQRYTYKRQAERRNLTQGEILQAAMLLENKKNRDGSGRSSKKLGDDLGMSESTITNAVFVGKNADDKDIQDIKDGKTTINKVRQKLKSRRKKDTVKQTYLSHNFSKPDNNVITTGNPIETISLSAQQDNLTEFIYDAHSTNNDKENKNALVTDEQNILSTNILMVINNVLKALSKYNENNAIKIILGVYKEEIPHNVFSELKNKYLSN
jgi:ParB-like chromosome segregation protein Spo0J